MGIVEVPGLGAVVVRLVRHRFGMTNEVVNILGDVRWPNGNLVGCVEHEKTAAHLEKLGFL